MGVADTSGISYIDANLFYCTYFFSKTNAIRRQEYLAVALVISTVSELYDIRWYNGSLAAPILSFTGSFCFQSYEIWASLNPSRQKICIIIN